MLPSAAVKFARSTSLALPVRTLMDVLTTHVHKDTHLMTDSSNRYNLLKREQPFRAHTQLNHSKGEYVRGIITTK
jgi:hypothetical protein